MTVMYANGETEEGAVREGKVDAGGVQIQIPVVELTAVQHSS